MNEWNRNNLAGFLDDQESGLLYFYTPLCGTCQVASRMLVVLEELVKVNMGKMNLNFYPDIAANFGIESVPCLLIVQKGKVKETIYAFHSVPYLLEKTKQYLT
ncbi:thioredoxin family protein [Neobacillus vireti]|uniref:Thioredoxin n=1 Tax=Neobacillus vireti LMG 21834 TaxID=1131730 RepID=A0AB94IG55_9BACI|nr:thioredoxin family protein [Neobacillus vireti]ETI66093.1 thioredoxin [Neobacillus vireti LMG 21834]KLT18396.1 thioredoxin [Neobacillus vireti]